MSTGDKDYYQPLNTNDKDYYQSFYSVIESLYMRLGREGAGIVGRALIDSLPDKVVKGIQEKANEKEKLIENEKEKLIENEKEKEKLIEHQSPVPERSVIPLDDRKCGNCRKFSARSHRCGIDNSDTKPDSLSCMWISKYFIEKDKVNR